MRLAIMQPYFFPYLGYFQLINSVDKFMLYDDVDFIRRGWINRNKILIKYQKPTYITVPVQKKSSHKNISEILIDNKTDWRKKTLELIYFNYKKAVFFEEIFPYIERIFNHQTAFLSTLNSFCIETIVKGLGVSTEIISHSDYSQLEKKLLSENYIEYFPQIQLDDPERKVIRILEIAKNEKANTYINPIGGKVLYSKDDFIKNGLEIYFLQMENIEYPQFSKSFFSSLSIIDVLMHNGWEDTNLLLNKYKLI